MPTDDLLYVEEFVAVKQKVTAVSVSFDDQAVADLFDMQVDAGRKPEQFARCWVHTHPSNSADPSMTDEETFMRVFGRCDWAVLFILAQDNSTYARISFNIGPGGQMLIPVQVDYSRQFPASDQDAWEAEYLANIQTEKCVVSLDQNSQVDQTWPDEHQVETQEMAFNDLSW